MKRLIIPVCFAATAAVASELKDPSTVARDWQQAVQQARRPIGSSTSLVPQRDTLTTTPVENLFGADGRAASPPALPRPLLIDAPSYKIPEQLPNIRPTGAIPGEYNGRVYWLVPLNSSDGK